MVRDVWRARRFSIGVAAFVVWAADPAAMAQTCPGDSGSTAQALTLKWRATRLLIEDSKRDHQISRDEGRQIRQAQRELQSPTARLAKLLRDSPNRQIAELSGGLAQAIVDLDSVDDDENWDDDVQKIMLLSDQIKRLADLCTGEPGLTKGAAPSGAPSSPPPSPPLDRAGIRAGASVSSDEPACTPDFVTLQSMVPGLWTVVQANADEARRNGEISSAEAANLRELAGKAKGVTIPVAAALQQSKDPALVRAGAGLAKELAALDKVDDDDDLTDDFVAVGRILATAKLLYAACPALQTSKELFPEGPWPEATSRTNGLVDLTSLADQSASDAAVVVLSQDKQPKFVGVVPVRIALAPGQYTVRVLKSGYLLHDETQTIVEGQIRRLVVGLIREPPAPRKRKSKPELDTLHPQSKRFSIGAKQRRILAVSVPKNTVGAFYRFLVGSDGSDTFESLVSLIDKTAGASGDPRIAVAAAAGQLINSLSDFEGTFYLFPTKQDADSWEGGAPPNYCPGTGDRVRSAAGMLSNDCVGESTTLFIGFETSATRRTYWITFEEVPLVDRAAQ
jgi:hypothetical protein